MSQHRILGLSRRQFVRTLLATSAFGLTAKLGTGCTSGSSSGGDPTATGEAPAAGSTEPMVIGFIYVGPKDDFGWNQSHALGASGTKEKLSFVQLVEEESVPETSAAAESMRSMIDIDGAKVLFPTSFGYYDPHVLAMAEEYPDVQFFHAGGLYQEGVHPKNVGTYYGFIDEAQYISGIVAGLTVASGKMGFVAAKPIPTLLRNINSFTLGARSVNPAATVQVIFTGDWSVPLKEAEAVNSMADQGIEMVTCHVDSPKVVMETAEKRGMFCGGYHTDQTSLAPTGYLTGAEWDWTAFYSGLVEELAAGKTLMDGSIPHVLRGGLKEGFCKMSPYGPAVSDEAKAAADAAIAQFMDGTMVIYKGELKDNKGNVVIASGGEMKQQDPILEQMNYLVEGAIGTI